jgi:hypothetical protein
MEKKEMEFEFERATKNAYMFQGAKEGEGCVGMGVSITETQGKVGEREMTKIKDILDW